jgi:tRNA A37 threonylcarbamoyladenosine modification protein TsaB
VLILGIETATEMVGVAIGGHEGVIASFEVARGRRHAEILTPAIDFVCRQADIGLSEVGCVGDGAERYREAIVEGHRCEVGPPVHPSAGALVQLAHSRALREDWVRPHEIEPVYLRAPDAKINWAIREARP